MMNRESDPNLPLILGSWFSKCGERIEANGGAINKYLGDGWLAFWPDEAGSEERVAAALTALSQMQGNGGLDFRLVVHCGPVLVGGMPSNFEDALLGPEVNFIFRVEKVAGALGARRCLTEAAAERLGRQLTVESLGTHSIKDFSEAHGLFTFARTSI
jgi:adenylate cyclase